MSFSLAAVLGAGVAGIALALSLCGVFARIGFPVPEERRRLGAIDGLRGYLALLVMVHHFSIYLRMSIAGGGWHRPEAAVLNAFGTVSVGLFFMITGALFFPKTWDGFARADWRSLYVSRAFRILPLQVVAVALIATIALVRVRFAIGDTLGDAPAQLLLWLTSYAQPALFGYRDSAMINAFVLWSLRVEWKFYLIVLPLVALAFDLAGRRRGRWAIPVAMLVAGTAFRYSGIGPLQNQNYSLFACGMLALLVRSSRFAPLFCGMPAAAAGGAALVFAMTLLPEPDHPLALAAYMLFFTCVICGNRFGGLFSTRGALILGEASFSIYMLHGILLNVVFVSGADIVAAIPAAARPWLLVVLIPAMSGIAVLAYLLVERPGIALGRRLAGRWGRRPQGKAEVSAEVVAP